MFLVDAHLDLSMNALEWNRDLREPVAAIRAREAGLTDRPDRGRNTVSLPELRRGRIGLVVATQIARYVAPGNPLPGWHSAEQAWAQTQGQLAWYREMEKAGEMTAVTDLASLEAHLAAWQAPAADPEALPIGYIRSLEGADSLVTVDYLRQAVRDGLRAVGPAHYGPGRYAPGTHTTGPLEANGPALLAAMEQLGVILDVTHLSDDSLWQALDLFGGAVWASHHNARALVADQRQLPDDQIKAIVARGAVIGASCDAWMIVPGWVRGTSTPQSTGCTFERLADHVRAHLRAGRIDAPRVHRFGSRRRVRDGTDAVGSRHIVDLHRLCDVLGARGFSDEDLERLPLAQRRGFPSRPLGRTGVDRMNRRSMIVTGAAAFMGLAASGRAIRAGTAGPAASTQPSQQPDPSLTVRVMSFNIRYGTANDGDDHWDKRKDFLVDVIRAEAPDVIGVQEALYPQLAHILQRAARVCDGGRRARRRQSRRRAFVDSLSHADALGEPQRHVLVLGHTDGRGVEELGQHHHAHLHVGAVRDAGRAAVLRLQRAPRPPVAALAREVRGAAARTDRRARPEAARGGDGRLQRRREEPRGRRRCWRVACCATPSA